MKPKLYESVCCIVLLTGSLITYARTVISESTKEPVIYASVGIINRDLGTVADTLGNFSLKIPPEYINDSVRISSVGYVAKTFAVKDIALIPDTIELADKIIMLNEVTVKPQKIKHKLAGRKGGGGFIGIDVEGYKAAGQGLAIPLTVKKRAWLSGIGFSLVRSSQTLSHMKFRVNIYRKENGRYILENINPVYFDYDKSQLIKDSFYYTFPEEIMLDKGDFYVELEFLSNFFNEYFTMASIPLTGMTRYRYASQSEWQTLPFGAPVFVEYDCIE